MLFRSHHYALDREFPKQIRILGLVITVEYLHAVSCYRFSTKFDDYLDEEPFHFLVTTERVKNNGLETELQPLFRMVRIKYPAWGEMADKILGRKYGA